MTHPQSGLCSTMLALASAVPHAVVERERKEIYDSQVTEISFFPGILSNFLNRTQNLGTPGGYRRARLAESMEVLRLRRRRAQGTAQCAADGDERGAARDQLCTEQHASLRSISGG